MRIIALLALLASLTTASATESIVLTTAQCGSLIEGVDPTQTAVVSLPTGTIPSGCKFDFANNKSGPPIIVASNTSNIVPESYYYTSSGTNVPSLVGALLPYVLLQTNGSAVTLEWDGAHWAVVGGTPDATMWGGQSVNPSVLGLGKMLHQAGGATCQLHQAMMGDCNWVVTQDQTTTQSFDASIIYRAIVTGTPTAGEAPGIQWSIKGTTYNETYTIHAGDTLAQVTSGILATLTSDAALTQAYHDMDGRTGANVGPPTQIGFDLPYNCGGTDVCTATPINSAHVTVTILEGGMDNGPTQVIARYGPPGYVSRLGDVYNDWQIVCNYVFCAQWQTKLVNRDVNGIGNTYATEIGGSGPGGIGGVWIGEGLATTQKTDNNPCATAPRGSIIACDFVQAATYVQTGATTVASLPACNAAAEGRRYGVRDAAAATFGAILAGGGTVHTPAYCNGSNWVAG